MIFETEYRRKAMLLWEKEQGGLDETAVEPVIRHKSRWKEWIVSVLLAIGVVRSKVDS